MSTKKKLIYLAFFISFLLVILVSFSILKLKPSSYSKQIKNNFQPKIWSLLITGDIIPARSVNFQMTKYQNFNWALVNLKPILKQADLTFINLESPLLANCPVTNEGMVFCGNSRFATSLANNGIDIINLANNHSLNYGWEGLAETEQWLNQAGIQTTGYSSLIKDLGHSRLAILKVNKLKVGFLGFNAIEQVLDLQTIQKQIKQAKQKVDLLVVAMHWGKEYVFNPEPDPFNNQDPKKIAPLLIDWGADLIVGNHPHWIQTIEWYKDKPIFYALGNTVFDQEWSKETKQGILVKLYFQNKKLLKKQIKIIPIGIKDYGQAYLLEGQEKAKVLNRLTSPEGFR